MNKNLVIGILAVLLVLGFLWGQMGNRSGKAAKKDLKTAISQLEQAKEEVARLQTTAQMSEEQLAKAQNDLQKLRKATKVLEAKISKSEALVAALNREKEKLAEQVDKMKHSPAMAPDNQQQIDALRKQVADLQAALQAGKQHHAAATEKVKETKAKAEEKHALMWLKSEVIPAEPAAMSSEELRARLAAAQSSVNELQEKLAAAETEVEAQTQKLSAVQKELEETRAKVKGDYTTKVWIKSELSPIEQETQVKEKLQTELAKMKSSYAELQEKLAIAEKEAQRVQELQKILAQSESSIKELGEKLALVEQGPQKALELQGKLAEMEASFQKLQDKLAKAEQEVARVKELEGKLGESKAFIQELQEKLAQAETTNQELQGKLDEASLSIRELGDTVAALDQTKLTRKYKALRAQVTGLELMVEKRDAALEEMNKKLDHWRINKDLLLAEIADLQGQLEKLQEMNSGLLRDLAAKKKELAEEKKRN